MRLLLDTHVVLWWLSGHKRLNVDHRNLIEHADCHVSAASIWEVAIKHRLGKLPITPTELVTSIDDAGMRRLPINYEHAAATASLPNLHTDPFDRLLIAQARLERLILLSADDGVCAYGDGIRRL
jgi:PIN domain nuclease of toxin-antitoxin system